MRQKKQTLQRPSYRDLSSSLCRLPPKPTTCAYTEGQARYTHLWCQPFRHISRRNKISRPPLEIGGWGRIPKLCPGQVKYELHSCNPQILVSMKYALQPIVQPLMWPKLAFMSKAGVSLTGFLRVLRVKIQLTAEMQAIVGAMPQRFHPYTQGENFLLIYGQIQNQKWTDKTGRDWGEGGRTDTQREGKGEREDDCGSTDCLDVIVI